MTSFVESMFRQSASAQARAAGQQTLATITRSTLGLNGAALAVAGFFGVWSALSLRLQDSIISFYVLLFGARRLGRWTHLP